MKNGLCWWMVFLWYRFEAKSLNQPSFWQLCLQRLDHSQLGIDMMGFQDFESKLVDVTF